MSRAGNGQFSGDRSINVQILRLRRKLEPDQNRRAGATQLPQKRILLFGTLYSGSGYQFQEFLLKSFCRFVVFGSFWIHVELAIGPRPPLKCREHFRTKAHSFTV
jgi:hypothetical protein